MFDINLKILVDVFDLGLLHHLLLLSWNLQPATTWRKHNMEETELFMGEKDKTYLLSDGFSAMEFSMVNWSLGQISQWWIVR
jgi:hypothetical protein